MKPADLPVLPRSPGCYLWHAPTARAGDGGRVIYVGKAVDLRSRVRSYFGRHAGAKAQLITRDAERLEYIVTENEVEALILEANLIKRYQPHYNVLLKDDKSYPFLKLTNEPFPRLEFTRRVVKDGAQYFGPYPNPGVVRRVQELVAAVFPLRQNSGSPMQTRKKPCLRHHMGRCPAPCVGAADPVAYAATVAQVRAFLEGRVEETVTMLETEMRSAAARLDFELARTYRDRLEALKRLTGYESSVVSSGGEDLDFLGVAQAGDYAMVQLFQMRRGRVVGRDKRFLTGADGASSAEVLEPFLAEYYGMATHVPPLLLLPASDLDTATWTAFLARRAGRRVELRTPRRGDKVALVAMAERNARTGLEAELALLERRGEAPGVRELQGVLGLAAPPWRLEGFDVSNLMGTHTVASLVVFEGGRAKKSEYRRMRIHGLDAPDDFAAMHQAVLRRFTGRLADQLEPPDLVLIDGGKGQLAAARRALREAGVDLPVVALAKRIETIVTEDGRELLLPNAHPGLRLLIHARDEAHRVAVGYNRDRRGRAMTRSLLDDVPGVGPKRRDALLAHFSSVEQLRDAPVEALAAVPGVGRRAALAVKAYFDPATIAAVDGAATDADDEGEAPGGAGGRGTDAVAPAPSETGATSA